MAPSRRPIVDAFGSTWLGDPEGPDFSIEIADEYLGVSQPSGDVKVLWSDIAELDITIPTANWRLAVASHRVLSTMDALQVANSDAVNVANENRRGVKDIEVRVVLRDGTQIKGWAAKHQPLGYPRPEAEAAIAVLQARVSPSTS